VKCQCHTDLVRGRKEADAQLQGFVILVDKFPDDFAFMCRQIIPDYDQPAVTVRVFPSMKTIRFRPFSAFFISGHVSFFQRRINFSSR
jgi:hypothetical protein